jgi:tyrosine-protein kinase Etk/Wzc
MNSASALHPPVKDIRQIIRRYLRFWYLFVIGAALGGVAAFLYLRYYTVPLYSSSALVLIKASPKGEAGGGEAGLGEIGLFKPQKTIGNEIQILQSKALMERALRELGLSTQYHLEGQVSAVEILAQELPVRVVSEQPDSLVAGQAFQIQFQSDDAFDVYKEEIKRGTYRLGQSFALSGGRFRVEATDQYTPEALPRQNLLTVSFHDIRRLARDYSEALVVSPVDKEADVLSIQLINAFPGRGRDVLNKLLEVYNRESINDNNKSIASTIAFLDERLKYLADELSGVERNVEQYKRANEITDVSTQASAYVTENSDYNRKLAELNTQREILESTERHLLQDDHQHRPVPVTLGIADQTLIGLLGKYNDTQAARERLLRTNRPSSPLVSGANEQLGVLRNGILDNIQTLKRSLAITANSAQSNSGAFNSRIRKIPTIERRLQDINRQQSTKQNLYLYLLQKREEAALSLAATRSNMRVIESATSGDFPVSPSKSTTYLIYILLGLAIPFGFIYAADLINDTVRSRHEVTQLTAVPVLGELSLYKGQASHPGDRSALSEQLGLIRANLLFTSVDSPSKIILITSSTSGEGKTFFALHLGTSLALTGKRVIVLELDFRRPSLHTHLELNEGPGLTDYLASDDVELVDLLHVHPETPHLYLSPCGPVPFNPAELLMSSKLTSLIQELKKSFDYVLLDTPPVGQVADAFAVNGLVDSTILLARYNYTTRNQLESLDAMALSGAIKRPALVLNGAAQKTAYSYYRPTRESPQLPSLKS